MRHSNPIELVLLSLVVFLLQFGMIQEADAISIEDESLMGQKFLESIRKEFALLDDDFASDFLNDLGQYLVQSAETRPFPFQFYTIQDGTLNAFAGPGGHIFVFGGLISTMETIDELAAVMTHEIGHVTARHLSERMEQAQKIGFATMAGMLASILVGGKGAGAIMSGTMAAGIQKQLSYSREDERQADQLGFQYMCRSGFDPGGMITTLTTLDKGQWHGVDSVPPYLLTHPGGPERISNIQSMISTRPEQQGSRQSNSKYRELYPFFRTVVQAKTGDPHDMENLFRKALEKDPNCPIAHFGLGILWQERSEHDKAIESFRNSLKARPETLPVMRKLAESYQLKGLDREAVEILERAFRADTQDKASIFLLARSYQNMEEHGKAIRMLERLLLLKPVKEEVYYNLGVSYGRENRLALAHYNFGIFFKKQGEGNKSRFHFQKAEDLSRGDPVLTEKIRQEMGPLSKR